MRLTAELITTSLTYLNPLKERELDLRGHKIPLLENLAPASDCDAIDLTDNALPSLQNFPLFPRLKSLYCARNRISSFAPTIGKQLPNLHTLVLTENVVSELADLEPLRGCRGLTHLSLLENPVRNREGYRLWVIWLCPSVRFLDFERVRDEERRRARDAFGEGWEEMSEAATKVLAVRQGKAAGGVEVNGVEEKKGKVRTRMTEEERKRVEKMIREAKSLREIERLEKMLVEGRIPG